ncbi:MAG: histidine phosphatase family protein [Rhizobiaceae bacterium]|nr:histidine phosphatase family protein [Rhizobiaceae bacterium]
MRIQGQHDIPINDTGRKQARTNGQTLAKLLDDPKRYRYIASPLGRTRETMNIVRQELGLPSHGYETDDRLKEIYFGLWQTFTMEELRQTEPELVAAREADKFNFTPPLGESYFQVLARLKSWLPYVTEDSVVVCHGGILRMLEHHFNNTPTDEVAHITVPQDRIYKWDGKLAQWL